MKEMKPTANAANTVASTSVAAIIGVTTSGVGGPVSSQVVALQVGIEPRSVGAGRRRGARTASASTSPPDHGERDPAEREQDRQRRDRVHEHVAELVVAALVARQGQHALAELRNEGGLDLLLGAAVGDLLLDEGALLLGLGRLGREAERGAADRAHHFVLDVAEGGLGAVLGERGGRR